MILQFFVSLCGFTGSLASLNRPPLRGTLNTDMGEPPLLPKDYLTRIKPNQVMCRIAGCKKSAAFLLYKDSGAPKRIVMAYCEDHVKLVADSLGIPIPRA
jgi:hypothetical protein